MPAKIELLQEETINLIAAGEVVENPSSIVKELLENSVDAGATSISIHIANGGIDRIVVEDNGSGMSGEDVLLSILRHATSKIRTHEDLNALATFGFRGEALSSIAASSKLTIHTKENIDAAQTVGDGVVLSSEGGKNVLVSPTTCRAGTKIEVNELFYNTPARRKFLKSPNKCAVDVTKVVTAIALAHPEIAFELVVETDRVLSVQRSSLEERLSDILGSQFFSSAQKVVIERDGITLTGFFASPEVSRYNRSGQYIFVMDRYISSPFISAVVKDAYGTTIDKERHPLFVLYLNFAPGGCDVNVHPQKKEVRFQDEDAIRALLWSAVQKAIFVKNEPTSNFDTGFQEKTFVPAGEKKEIAFSSPKYSVHNHSVHNFEVRKEDYLPPLPPFKAVEKAPELNLFSCSILGIFEHYALANISWGDNQVLDELKKPGIIVIDIEALFTALLEEKVKKENSESQLLLTPIFIEFSVSDMEKLKDALPELQKIGFSVRPFGTSSILVEAIPTSLRADDVEPFIRMLCEDAQKNIPLVSSKVFAARMSRGASVETVSKGVHELLENVNRLYISVNRPIFALLSADTLRKLF